MIKSEELTQMKARAEKATAGESIWLGETSEGHVLHSVLDIYGPDAEVYIKEGFVEFTEHAREDVPRLVAEVERLNAEITEYRRGHTHLHDVAMRKDYENARLRAALETIQNELFAIRGVDTRHDSNITSICVNIRRVLNGGDYE